MDAKRVAGEHRRALGAREDELLRRARVEACRGDDAAERAIGEAQTGADEVLGLHAMEPAGSRHGGDLGDRPGEAQHEIEGMDRLADQHAAAVPGKSAAAGLVVIGLGAPPGHGKLGQGEIAERALRQ